MLKICNLSSKTSQVLKGWSLVLDFGIKELKCMQDEFHKVKIHIYSITGNISKWFNVCFQQMSNYKIDKKKKPQI